MRSGQGGVGCSQHRVRTEPPRAGQSGQPARRAEPSGPPRVQLPKKKKLLANIQQHKFIKTTSLLMES